MSGMTNDEKTDLKELITITIKHAVLEGTEEIKKIQAIQCEEIKYIKEAQKVIADKVESNENLSKENKNRLDGWDNTAKKSGGIWGGIISGGLIALKFMYDLFSGGR